MRLLKDGNSKSTQILLGSVSRNVLVDEVEVMFNFSKIEEVAIVLVSPMVVCLILAAFSGYK